ncbi:DNA polymerase III subunit chi [Alginatibacterium sediminis]|uniref:DNA polymerase III subunit chi n=1 Tax=Alginatibacterium sediminis TaxID=2164068 RepID=A0A420EDA5_9ALTE|nr:DNA polymerase III subunit chi [Alginatibacterium sediminis]RKF18653.1 DNA polymerase III subunit chi [Alginatibacterium sediminis]
MNAKFYIMSGSVSADSSELDEAACQIISRHYRNGEKVFVLANSQQHAERIDEILWRFDTAQFVPHSLSGENPQQASPVEIAWQPVNARRQTLINLASSAPNTATYYQQIIDFVPGDEAGKKQARDRYRLYRQMGIQLETLTYNDEFEDLS